ncbi:MAG: MFS transporter, partial [Clostridia bacterium]|nr:MFS transporter [Clostridia bacterium]
PMIEALPGDAKESAMSILHSFYCWGFVGVVTLSTLYFYVFGTDEWYVLPILWAIVPVITLIMFSVVPIRELNDSAPSMPLTDLFRTKMFWLFLLLMICGGAAEQAMGQWASLFAEAALGVSKTVGNLLGPCFFALAMGTTRGLYGKYAEKLPIKKALLICALIALGGYLMVSLIPNPYSALIGCGVIGIGVGLFWPGVLSIASKAIPAGGTAMFAILAVCGDIGCSVGPQVAAVVSEINGAGLSMGLLACVVFPLTIAVSMLINIKKHKDI